MSYRLRSLKTRSYWIYALCSPNSLTTFVAVVAGIWTFIDILNSFKVINKEALSLYWLIPLFLTGIFVVVFTRRPVSKIKYKHPGMDLAIEVIIGDFFSVPGQKIISTNTTFDTDLANGIISPKSLQGQFTQTYYQGNISQLDLEIEKELKVFSHSKIEKKNGKTDRYDFGTTVKLKIANEYFYWFAMAEMNESNIARTTLKDVNKALEGLWDFIANKGEKLETVIPLVGSGHGRLSTNRKRLIAIIAQSFITASEEHVFANKLSIVVYPPDAESSNLNLFEVKDLLQHYLS